ncbi:MAG: hypothetical protein AAGA74_15655 [Pseudomonadota bacterium]
MTHELFKAAYGNEGLGLKDALLKVHDAAPNAEKRSWRLLAKASDDTMLTQNERNVSLLAHALEDAARKRLNAIISSVTNSEDVVTHKQAVDLVKSTSIGSALSDLLVATERTAIETCSLSKRVKKSLDDKADQKRVFSKAREIQVRKAREGRSISLLDAFEIAQASA